MKASCSRCLGLSLVLLVPFSVCQSAERVALLFGNSKYEHAGLLDNAGNDARLLAKTLEQGGFEVDLVLDATLETMEERVANFHRKAIGASAAWFYYAGHGLEVKGSNYLMPVDANVQEEFQVKNRSLSLDTVLAALDDARTPLKVIVLDCCRENPFGRSWSRSMSKGLSAVSVAPEGTIIAFAAAPGMLAADSVGGENSPYTLALVEALSKPGLKIDQVFMETGRRVKEETGNLQQPWINISFYDSFVVIQSPDGVSPAAPVPMLQVPPGTPAAPISASPQEMPRAALADAASAGKKVVLSVGVDEPRKEGFPKLTAADSDAEKVAEAFRHIGSSGDRIVTMTSASGHGTNVKYSSPFYPSTENIRIMMGDEFSGLRPQDLVVFSFAGYEVQREGDEDFYFMTGDGDNEDATTLISLSEVYRAILQSGAGSGIVLIDACRHNETSGPLNPPPGIAVFFSCSRGEFAIESADTDPPSGLFTDSLVAAMKGAADFNRDGKVEWRELTAYVTREVARRAEELGDSTSQIPEHFGMPSCSPVFAVPAVE